MDRHHEIPKYRQLIDYLKECIQKGELVQGSKIPSENELSAQFSISRHTVRQAVGELVSEGWLNRTRGSGTFVSFKKRRERQESKIIGVVTTYLDDYIFPGIIKGIDNVLSRHGYSMILSHTNNKVEREALCLSSMLQKNVDGFIIEPTKSALPNPNLDFYSDMDDNGMPYILINGYYPGCEFSYVIEDDENGGYIAAEHLFEQGHRKIGGIFKVDDIQGHNRYKGVVKSHRKRKLSVDEDSVIWYTTEDMDSLFDFNGRKALLKRFFGCTGIICYNDQIALKLMDILKMDGKRVPDDISIVGFDDSELATASEVKLTSVAHPGCRLGEKAAYGLLNLLSHKIERVREIIKPELIVRDSTNFK